MATTASYDVIGDIHGHADKLLALLAKLGYHERHGAWRHPDHMAIFVGDFIDRGPGQLQTVDIARRMLDAGSALAVMGNHEFNAIAWYLPDHNSLGASLRTRTGELGAKNRQQHERFLEEVEEKPKLHREIIEWFLSLPLWLELPALRVVHACWHPRYIAELSDRLTPARTLTIDLMASASRKGSLEYVAVEALTKGLEVPLPEGRAFRDKDGHMRTAVRTRWWDADARTYRQAALMSGEERAALPDAPIPPEFRLGYAGDKPLFFGHYWRTGMPSPLSSTLACVDYSAGKGGPLVAYQWDGERELDERNFIAVA